MSINYVDQIFFYTTQLDLNDLNYLEFLWDTDSFYIYCFQSWKVIEAVAKSAVESKAWWCHHRDGNEVKSEASSFHVTF